MNLQLLSHRWLTVGLVVYRITTIHQLLNFPFACMRTCWFADAY